MTERRSRMKKKEYSKPESKIEALMTEELCASGVPQTEKVSATITISSDDWELDNGVVDIF